MVIFRRAANTLTSLRVICGLVLLFWPSLPLRPSVAVLLLGVVTDWLDGPLARRTVPTPIGARFDLEADSLLTLGAAVAAVRRGAPAVVLVAPFARYGVVPAQDRDDVRWDRTTGVTQMLLLAGALARLPVTWLMIPVTAARCAVLVARVNRAR